MQPLVMSILFKLPDSMPLPFGLKGAALRALADPIELASDADARQRVVDDHHADVNEHILASAVGLNEVEILCDVEPLNRA
jgi:hypothetical protein